MELIRKRRNGYALLFPASICLVVWLGVKFMLKAAFVFGTISAISLFLLVRQHLLLRDARLIWENPILVVPSASLSVVGVPQKEDRSKSETVVSTFGMLIGSKIYRWGLDGVHGVRLNTVEIDRERMHLTFGDAAQIMRVDFLHGLNQKQTVLEVAQKLLHETGVRADITGW